jgi:hypothetical protein
MKLRLLTLLAAAALAAAPAAAQTIKSLGYNTTNGNVVYSGTNPLTFTNPLQFATNARADTRTNLGGTTVGNAVFTATNAAAAQVALFTTNVEINNPAGIAALSLSEGQTKLLSPISFPYLNGPAAAATTRTNLGGTTVGNAVFTATNAAAARTGLGLGDWAVLSDGSALRSETLTISDGEQLDYIQFTAGLGVSFFGNRASQFRTALGLDTTNNVTFNEVTMNGVGNTAPSQTASSGASLMTRDLVGQELANPRNRMQTTYWFGLEGLGEWSLIGSGAIGGYGGASGGLGGGQNIYSSQLVGTNHAGAALRLGNDTALGTSGIYRFIDGGALTMRVRLRRSDTISVPAIAFVMGQRTATQMWQQDAYGIYFVPQPTNAWTSNAVVTQHTRIAVSNVVWSVNTAGTNGATEPTWTDLIGSLVTNGSAVYRNLGPHTSNNYVLAIGSTNASQVVMTNTGKAGPVVGARQEIVLKLRIDGTTNTPYTVYGTAENSAGESSEVSLTTTNNDNRQPQIWSRPDNLGTRSFSVFDLLIRYFSVDGNLNPL